MHEHFVVKAESLQHLVDDFCTLNLGEQFLVVAVALVASLLFVEVVNVTWSVGWWLLGYRHKKKEELKCCLPDPQVFHDSFREPYCQPMCESVEEKDTNCKHLAKLHASLIEVLDNIQRNSLDAVKSANKEALLTVEKVVDSFNCTENEDEE